eukprot:7576738-Pyramimonas_sp.AAC.1
MERQAVRIAFISLYFPPSTREKSQQLKYTKCCEAIIRWLSKVLGSLAGRWTHIITMDLKSAFTEEVS